MGPNNFCSTGLSLKLGLEWNRYDAIPNSSVSQPSSKPRSMSLHPSLTLSLAADTSSKASPVETAGREEASNGQQSSHSSSVSSFLSGSLDLGNGIKRERDGGVEDEEIQRPQFRVCDEEEDVCTRKKLRLNKDQSALLEESFKQHSTLNPKQKQDLARRLNLKPRQVEVWFQNRRARTKLKQTEIDCELLKKCCQALADENRRLHKELQELRAHRFPSPLYMKLPGAKMTICPSCERVYGSGGGGGSAVPWTQNLIPTAAPSPRPLQLVEATRAN